MDGSVFYLSDREDEDEEALDNASPETSPETSPDAPSDEDDDDVPQSPAQPQSMSFFMLCFLQIPCMMRHDDV